MSKQTNLFFNLPASKLKKQLTPKAFQRVEGRKFVLARTDIKDIGKLENMLVGILNGELVELKDFKSFFSNLAIKGQYNFLKFANLSNVKDWRNKLLISQKTSKEQLEEAKELFDFSSLELKAITSESMEYVESYFKDLSQDLGIDKNGVVSKNVDITEDLINSYKNRAKLLAQCEVARVVRQSTTKVAKESGATRWMWGSTSSHNPSEDHEVLVGKISKIGETPDPDGYFPSERANCKCEMIFLNDVE